MNNYILLLHCFFGGALGAIVATWFKFTNLRKLMRKADPKTPFTFSRYWDDEYPSFVSAILSVILLCFLLKEFTAKWPVIMEWVRNLSVFGGWVGHKIIQRAVGNAEKTVLNFIDKKTSLADKFLSEHVVSGQDVQEVEEARQAVTKKNDAL
jgi:hypothetical protein